MVGTVGLCLHGFGVLGGMGFAKTHAKTRRREEVGSVSSPRARPGVQLLTPTSDSQAPARRPGRRK